MLETPVHCHRLIQLPLPELIGMQGIYVMWDARHGERPLYIGGGNLLRRLARYFRREGEKFQESLDGYVGIVGPEKDQAARKYTKAITHLLLDVAADIGRPPRSEATQSSPEALLELLRRHGSYKVSFHRHDPLTSPSSVVPLQDARTITAWTLDRDDYWA